MFIYFQVDKSVLKELPEELQKEIRNELIRPDPEVRPGPSKSPRKPGKKISPSKRGRKKNLGTSTAGQTSVKVCIYNLFKRFIFCFVGTVQNYALHFLP